MRRTLLLVALSLVVILTAVSCKDITDSFKPGNFGGSAQEQAMVNALTSKHGDLRESGPPRILETMMTSKVENGMPADKVSAYSKDSAKLYVWFVYDNFNEDTIEIEWVYLDRNHSIHTFKSQTGKDFGRGTFILEKPTDGWPLGSYRVIVRGKGVTSTVEFKIVAGATVSTPILLPGGKVELPSKPGWHLIGTDYLVSSGDVTKHQNRYYSETNLMGTSSKLYDYIEGTGGKNNFTVARWRTGGDGKQIAGSKSISKWDDPPSYLEPDRKVSLKVQRSYDPTNSTWGQSGMLIRFDSIDLPGAGYATSSTISFVTATGNTPWHAYDGVVESSRVIPKGKAGDRKAIWIGLDGYSFKYTYEWRD